MKRVGSREPFSIQHFISFVKELIVYHPLIVKIKIDFEILYPNL